MAAKTENTPTMQEYLEMDNNMAFNIALYKRYACVGNGYSEICGSFIEGVIQWAYHHISHITETGNSKYHGWIITFEDGSMSTQEGKVYIPNWVMEIKPKNWRHAKNMFNKYLIRHN